MVCNPLPRDRLWLCPCGAVHRAGPEAGGAAALDELPAPDHRRDLHGRGSVLWQAGGRSQVTQLEMKLLSEAGINDVWYDRKLSVRKDETNPSISAPLVTGRWGDLLSRLGASSWSFVGTSSSCLPSPRERKRPASVSRSADPGPECSNRHPCARDVCKLQIVCCWLHVKVHFVPVLPQARSWRKVIQVNMELTEVRRQTDQSFISLLQAVRVGR